MQMIHLTKSSEDYLEAIFVLTKDSDSVKSVRIADHLLVSRPAVNKAMNELLECGLIDKTSYSGISLTESGHKIAESIYQKHMIIKKFLVKIGVSEEVAEIDCCKIEHVVSDETIERLIEISEKIKND